MALPCGLEEVVFDNDDSPCMSICNLGMIVILVDVE